MVLNPIQSNSQKLKHLQITNNSRTNNTILDSTQLKALAYDKINVTQMFRFVFEKLENIVGKGENAGYKHFLLFPQCFQEAYL